jgi:hypothetical protein
MGKLGTNRWRYFTGSLQELHDAVGAEIYHVRLGPRFTMPSNPTESTTVGTKPLLCCKKKWTSFGIA